MTIFDVDEAKSRVCELSGCDAWEQFLDVNREWDWCDNHAGQFIHGELRGIVESMHSLQTAGGDIDQAQFSTLQARLKELEELRLEMEFDAEQWVQSVEITVPQLTDYKPSVGQHCGAIVAAIRHRLTNWESLLREGASQGFLPSSRHEDTWAVDDAQSHYETLKGRINRAINVALRAAGIDLDAFPAAHEQRVDLDDDSGFDDTDCDEEDDEDLWCGAAVADDE